ncbi:MAG: RNA polymerase sigma factor [Cyclobacteriaceae bacterium]|jgi:RNA polymerase sigma factor (sigma-70 family)
MSGTEPFNENLFRHESGKLVAALANVFGPHQLQLAEDVAQDALLKALEHWKFHGVPANPSAWLFTVARNKALDILRTKRYEKTFAAEISALLKSEYTAGTVLKETLDPSRIEDEQLRMIFVCCHPALPTEAQVALTLKTLCGFSVAEIAHAFLTQEETITKRLYRARETLRAEKVAFTLPADHEIQARLESVLLAIYLIFNEGYHAARHPNLVREDVVEEALRLANLLAQYSAFQLPPVYALLALMCLNAARLPARLSPTGELVPLKNQDRMLWNRELIQQGRKFLERAATGNQLNVYHLEAAIAYEHCSADRYSNTNWPRIVQLYDWLLMQKNTPLVRLNRLIALGEWKGAEAVIPLALEPEMKQALANSALYYATLGSWYQQLGNLKQAYTHYQHAIEHSTSEAEQSHFRKRLEATVSQP